MRAELGVSRPLGGVRLSAASAQHGIIEIRDTSIRSGYFTRSQPIIYVLAVTRFIRFTPAIKL